MKHAFFGFALYAALSACLVHRESTAFECDTTADCTDNRKCESGYCVAQNCPAGCTVCDEAAKTCDMQCTDSGSCGGVVCPSLWTCTISCTGAGSCADVTCGANSKCSLACSGAGSCASVTCKDACKCDTTCVSGSCAMTSCPVIGNGGTQIRCTTDGTNGAPCTSSADSQCTRC